MKKQYLRTSLNIGMYGIQQMPALYFNTPFASADEINQSTYKILINEPLRDIFRKNRHMFLKRIKHTEKILLPHHSMEKRHKIQQITKKVC